MISLDFLSFYTAAFARTKHQKRPAWDLPAVAARLRSFYPAQGDIALRKVPRVKFVHSDGRQKDIPPRGLLRPGFEKATLCGGVVLRVTLLAAGPRGFPSHRSLSRTCK